ncbi:DUF998 domain-containing protein [Sinomonas sp. ASV322]|uniref:DUF998 domain-containing protein n=1 Tax=Sinomonas sp. ASV322 TaxID=3041920 RepID=UPI0027DB5823|nr:DUF998 domain-containing protein [Sinomonas sp. ASV322]MDQ4503155.1 DUF998 domain-containing protein [Sinomonas sp. ASV322]
MRSRNPFPAPADVRHYLGAWSAVSVIQYFVAEAAGAIAWAGHEVYSYATNVISDLGAAHCAVHYGRYVCSPLDWLFDGSLVLQGAGLIIAALLISTTVLRVAAHRTAVRAHERLTAAMAGAGTRSHPAVRRGHLVALAVRVLFGIGGAGLIVVGLVQEDVIGWLHGTGALAYFASGATALIVLGLQWRRRTRAGWVLMALGVVAGASTVILVVTRLNVPLPGALERGIVYPITLGMVVMGAVIAAGAQRTRAAIRAERAAGASRAT